MKAISLIVSISVFSVCMVAVWFFHPLEVDTQLMVVGSLYALMCFFFLLFQIWAFFKSHVEYDSSIEDIKYKVFEWEKEES